jgi:hypothetical protein
MRTISICRATASLTLALLTTVGCGAKTNGGGGSQAGSTGNGNTGGSSGGSSGGNTGGSGGSSNAVPGVCDNPTLEVLFSPAYSAFDGMHTFKVPAVVNSIDPTAVTWTASDNSYVDITQDATLGGVMLTTRKPGSVKIIASAGGLCGVSNLTIAQAASDDWMVGSARYNDGIVLRGLPRGNRPPDDGGVNQREAACTNCHGDTATMGPFKTVQHTPQQTGGFSDDDLVNIFTKGMVPAGGYFDEMIVPYRTWQGFHHWDMTPEQAKGVIVYLRSLTPASQTGMRGDFGGMRGDGGRMRGDGGRMRGDGGGMNPGTGGAGGSAGGEDASATD